MREDLIIVFTSEEFELADLLSDETWCNKVAFLADNSRDLDTLNKSMHERMNIFLLVLIKLTLLRKN
jgi:hypothetical protein